MARGGLLSAYHHAGFSGEKRTASGNCSTDENTHTGLVPTDTHLAAGELVSLKLDKPLYFDASGERVRG
jgi:hypothetical protein